MIYFLDGSVAVKRYVPEEGSPRVAALFRRGSEIVVSRITFAETCSAITRAWRAARLTIEERDRGLNQLEVDFHAFRVVEARRSVIGLVRELTVRWPLRGYDAVQLVSALKLRAEGIAVDFWCSDEALARAARAEGMRATLV